MIIVGIILWLVAAVIAIAGFVLAALGIDFTRDAMKAERGTVAQEVHIRDACGTLVAALVVFLCAGIVGYWAWSLVEAGW